MLRLGRQNIDIPPGDKDYTITDSFVLPVDVEVQAVQPHAHYRAREVTGTATLPDGTTRPLIHIADWDFRWQHVYRYVKPFALPEGHDGCRCASSTTTPRRTRATRRSRRSASTGASDRPTRWAISGSRC